MPSPEELGLGGRPDIVAQLDWSTARRQLENLGAVSFQLERLSQGGYRFGCRLVASGQTVPITANATTEAEAVQLVLQQAEQWRAQH